jgi:phosphatidylserine/phosphatidylglycerophosphate/cardiolipin synthase-like enzyme
MLRLRRALVHAVLLLAAIPPAARGAPPIQLVETRPVETALGNPDLPAAADVWVEMISSAKRTIDLEQMYFTHWPNEPLGPVMDALGSAAARGVNVRLILSSGMYRTYPWPADSLAKLANVEVRVLDMKKVSGGGIQHSKHFIVDGEQVYVGSQNFDWRALKHIHELGVRVRDARIAALYTRVFEDDWKVADPGAGETETSPAASPVLELPATPVRIGQAPGDTARVWATFSPIGHIPDPSLSDRDAIVRLLDGARDEVVVQLRSYGNGRRGGEARDSTIDLAIRRAAGRGVKVRMVVSDWEADNARLEDLRALTGVKNVEVKLSSVPEWSGGYIPFARVQHCKFMVVDMKTLWIGTSNWEPDYFRTSRNAAMVIESRPVAIQARRVFRSSWEAPFARPLTAETKVEKRIHGEEPPPGKTAYGR